MTLWDQLKRVLAGEHVELDADEFQRKWDLYMAGKGPMPNLDQGVIALVKALERQKAGKP